MNARSVERVVAFALKFHSTARSLRWPVNIEPTICNGHLPYIRDALEERVGSWTQGVRGQWNKPPRRGKGPKVGRILLFSNLVPRAFLRPPSPRRRKALGTRLFM